MADSKESSGVMEAVAIAALIFFLWWLTRKKVNYIGEPSTTESEIKDEFAADPNFNMNEYCQNVIYKPLSTSNLTSSNLLGEGWCYRGDRSAIDETKGFGDAYAEEQAKKYTEMKQDEAILINNKLSVQFRLINTTTTPITTSVLDVIQDLAPFNTGMDAPVSGAATAIGENGFTANWSAVSNASGYYLDIATDLSFLSYVTGYVAKDVGDVLSAVVTRIGAGTTYYYRVRAYNTSAESENSQIITVVTDSIIDVDGNSYSSVIIGTQEWLTENLKTTKYIDGTAIPNLTVDADWMADVTGAHCYYNNDITNKADYGALYNWYAVNNPHVLAPTGWRVSSDADFATLITFLGGDAVAGGKLKEQGLTHWATPNTGATDEYGFSGVGSGQRGFGASFNAINFIKFIWTSTVSGSLSKAKMLQYQLSSLVNQDSNRTYGFSVRCMRDI